MENKPAVVINIIDSSDDEDMNNFMKQRKSKIKIPKKIFIEDEDDDDSDSSDGCVELLHVTKKQSRKVEEDDDDSDSSDGCVELLHVTKKQPRKGDSDTTTDIFKNHQYNGLLKKKQNGNRKKSNDDVIKNQFASDEEESPQVFSRLKRRKKTPTNTRKRKLELPTYLQKGVDRGEYTEDEARAMMENDDDGDWLSSRSKRKGNEKKKQPGKQKRKREAQKKTSYKELNNDFIANSDDDEEEEFLELASDEDDLLSAQSTSEDDVSSAASLSDEDDDYYDDDENKEEQEDIAAKKLVKECGERAQKIRQSITELMNERNMYRESILNKNNNNNSNNGSSSTINQRQKKSSDNSVWVNENVANGLFDGQYKLKDYQLTGLNWLIQLRANGINGILADEMGLGKTVQALSVIQFLYKIKNIRGPHLIIIPASTKDNWAREIRRWTPGLRGKLYYGTQAERAEFRREVVKSEIDIILCTYSIFERETNVEDRTYLKRFRFEYVICDEAHSLKNIASARFRNINSLNTNYRLLLSGTPVQNNMRELLGLISFAMPKMFGNKTGKKKSELFVSYFERKYDNGKASSAASVIKEVRAIIDPFILRRLKDEVLSEIPPKVEKTIKLDLENDHKDAYNWTLSQIKLQKEGKIQQTIAHLFSELRKAANHPILLQRLFNDKFDTICKISHENQIFGAECTLQAVKDYLKKEYNDYDINGLCLEYQSRSDVLKSFCLDRSYILNSAKFTWLRANLPVLIDEGHRILLFSQWTSIMDIMEELLNELGFVYLRLDGQTNVQERQELIDRFNTQADVYKIFMLSTRAGGLGINLTSADTVILHDIDFNPQIDRQAVDRVHRIGQEKPVQVFRLICKGTVDEKILQLAEGKYILDQNLLSDVKNSSPVKSKKKKRKGNSAPAAAKTMKQLLQDAIEQGEL